MKKFLEQSSWSRWSLSWSKGAVIGSIQHVIASTKCVAISLVLLAFLTACDDSSSASAENSEPAALSSAEKYGSSSSSRHCEECNDEAISSDSNAELNGSSRSSSSEKNAESSSSEKLSGASSSSADKMESSSNSEFLATPCKTETEDNCEYGTVLDDRDGQTYKTVKIGDQWWIAENLNYETDNSFCFKDSAEYCEKYGRLYTWAAAMDSAGTWSTNGKGCCYGSTCSPTFPVRGICPEGWHLPSITEFETLFTAVGGVQDEDYAYRWNGTGTVLKSTSGWYNDGNGTDTFGFSALPAGLRDSYGDYYDEGSIAHFWSSTEDGSGCAYDMYLNYNYDYAYLNYNDKYRGLSVRCLKD